MMNDDRPVAATPADSLASLDPAPGVAGIPRLLDELIWHVRHARAATQIILEEEDHPADNWHAAAAKWDYVAILATKLRDRTGSPARP
jgi:hypothetical protein